MPSLDIISADDHIHEPPDLWTSRAPARYKDQVPYVVHETDADWWIVEGKRFASFGPGTQTGQRFKDASKLKMEGRADDVRPGAYQAKYRLEDMDADGIEAAIFYPTVGLAVHFAASAELMGPICAAYNDWLAEFCNADPKRFFGMCQLSTDDVPGAVRELERCRKLGFVGAHIATYPGPDRRYSSKVYEPLWEAAASLDMPLGLHLGAQRPGPGNEMLSGPTAAFRAAYDYWVRMALADTIFTGVFERHPKLRFGAVEHELGWLPFFIQQIDYMYTQRIRGAEMVTYKDGALPSDFWRRNGYACFQQDAAGIRLRDVIGVDNILWGSDYPHVESTFPRSRELLRTTLAECTAEEQAKIKRENARRIFRLPS
jgi:predicted TIM-barrel fold metal-dependent hydrolase